LDQKISSTGEDARVDVDGLAADDLCEPFAARWPARPDEVAMRSSDGAVVADLREADAAVARRRPSLAALGLAAEAGTTGDHARQSL